MKPNNLNGEALFSLLTRLALIMAIPLLVYLWGTTVVYNLANFWNIVTPNKEADLLSRDLRTLVTSPTLAALPAAVKDDHLSVSGFAQEGVQVTLFVNDQPVANSRAGKDGAFSFDNVKLNAGDNSLYARATNNQKEESVPSAKMTVTYLNKPPFLEIPNLPDHQDVHQKDNSFTIRGRTDPQATVTVNGAQAFVDPNGSFSYNFPLADGENKITIVAADAAGNQTTLEKVINFSRS